MKLELKHLAPYLPHGLKIRGFDNSVNARIIDLLIKYGVERYTPILRPLSDLTKEIEHNCEMLVPIDWIRENLDYDEYAIDYYINHTERLPYEIEQKLFEWHFDYFKLIPKGLAIDINSLKQSL